MNFDDWVLKSHELRSGSILDLSKRQFIDCKVLLSNSAHVCVEVYREEDRRAFLILDRFPLQSQIYAARLSSQSSSLQGTRSTKMYWKIH